MISNNKQFQCEVVLPSTSMLHQAIGRPASTKARAKRSAAFTACLSLKEMNQLDQNLLPTHQKHLPKMRNAQLALTAKNTKPYDMRTKPRLWQETVGRPPVGLYATVIHLGRPDPSKPYQPLAILTRFPLPHFPAFTIYLGVNRRTNVVCRPTFGGVMVTKARMKAINDFTLRIFKDVFNKTYEEDLSKMPYWLVPVKPMTRMSAIEEAENVIDWDGVYEVHYNERLKWDETTPGGFFANRFMVDPLDGGRRYFTVAVDRKLKPLDPVPAGTSARRGRDCILQYTSSLYRSSRVKSLYKTEQPVIEAHLALHRRNWLDEITEQEMNAVTKCFICPEPLYISAVSFPSIYLQSNRLTKR